GVNMGRYTSREQATLSSAGVADFLRQFVDVPRARATLRLLEQVDFKDRRFFAEALDRTLAVALAEGEVDYVSPLGGMGDSSAMLYYFMNDVSAARRRPAIQLL